MILPLPKHALPAALREHASAQLLAAPEAERAEFCRSLASEHPEHRAGLEQLLRKIQGAERLLAESFPGPAAAADPSSIAGHRVVRRLGQGAFGTVFLCQQERPVARSVAIKILRHVDAEPQILRRFYVEQQVLASLSHPAITQIYDAGALPDGRPYFVMEFVSGPPITEFCATHGLDAASRIRLFIDVCRGVEHAHARGVLHRDLKPGNVLVVDSGAERHPKIIDFGIAKAVLAASGAGEKRALTESGRVIGTPGYMSPEQALGKVEEIDERTDVFALGVLLYELLTGDLPWPRGAWRETDTDPALPSARITKNARRSDRDATEARRLAARVRGDLDWITLRAVRRDLTERYASVRELADDLVRHLEGRPVLAGPPSILYRMRKLARRHRLSAFALLCAVLVAGAALIWSSLRARDAEDATHAAQARSDAAVAAVHGLLQRANDVKLRRLPHHQEMRSSLANDALGFYDAWLRERSEDPELRAGRCRALKTLSEVHTTLGQLDDALRTGHEAMSEAETLLALDADDVERRSLFADATEIYVKALHFGTRFAESLGHCVSAVAHLEACAAADPAAHGIAHSRALRLLSVTQQVIGERAASVENARRSIEVLEDLEARGIARADALDSLVWARFTLAAHLMQERRFDEAETLLAQAVEGFPGLRIDRARVTAAVLCQQAQVSYRRGDLEGAMPRLERGLEACASWRAQEPDEFRALAVMFPCVRDYARVLEARGDREAALAMMRRAIEVAETKAASYPEDLERIHDVRSVTYEFARALWNRFRRGDLETAAAWLRRCLALTQQGITAGGSQRPMLWEALSLAALVGDSAGEDTAARWDELAGELPNERALDEEEPAQQVVEAWVGVARSRLRRGQIDAARDALLATEYYFAAPHRVDSKLRSEVAHMHACVALAARDLAAVDIALAEMLALRSSWWGRWRALGCELAAWRLLREDAAAAEACAARRDAAESHGRAVSLALAENVAADPGDPWIAVPYGLAELGLAEIEADRGELAAAHARLTAALTGLERVEKEAHRDLWDEARVRAARELVQRLAEQVR